MTTATRMFPMMSGQCRLGPSIPFWLAERIHTLYVAVFGDIQTLERLGERGGFGWGEVAVLCQEYERKYGRDKLEAVVREWDRLDSQVRTSEDRT